MCVSSFLPFGKMLSKKKHTADNFLLKFQDEAKRFVNNLSFWNRTYGFSELSKTIQTAVKANTLV